MNIDAASIAQQFAQYDIAPFEQRYTRQLSQISQQTSAISKLKSALSTLENKMYDFTKTGSSLQQSEVKIEDDSYFDVASSGTASSANLDIFVKQLATNHQVAVSAGVADVNDKMSGGGKLDITVGGSVTTLSILDGDSDGNGETSYIEFVSYFNEVMGDQVEASLVKSGGEITMVFSSTEEGADNNFTLEGKNWQNVIDMFDGQVELVAGQDAEIHLGSENSSVVLTNGSNTFEDLIEGSSVTIKKAHETGDVATNFTVGGDIATTMASMKEFVDEYNTLLDEINSLTTTGSEDESRGILASDSSVRSIKTQLQSYLRDTFNDGSQDVSLSSLGLEIDRDGKLELDEDKFEEASSLYNIEEIFTGEAGLFNVMSDKIDTYTDFTDGSLKNKTDTLDLQRDRINDSLEKLDMKYEANYNRYLAQYTQLNMIQAQMDQTMSQFLF
ncbi:flagellar filament capping protein FliD [Vibrio sp. SS-MA-C1-2]|uniref:flagellar filament capping protein FliD n=1 Tax=Vibrio sp. SS-MA-C1-2 TaxID=2908646 RepID=UPI001F1A80F2|nr:flagellar filament capping protein FliD [Vibrio sp. SS-MA-C1-2]UJF18034.1 flagellar filament capping protein FliD [Vibrio sp. SS-MA-C1-2]